MKKIQLTALNIYKKNEKITPDPQYERWGTPHIKSVKIVKQIGELFL